MSPIDLTQLFPTKLSEFEISLSVESYWKLSKFSEISTMLKSALRKSVRAGSGRSFQVPCVTIKGASLHFAQVCSQVLIWCTKYYRFFLITKYIIFFKYRFGRKLKSCLPFHLYHNSMIRNCKFFSSVFELQICLQ